MSAPLLLLAAAIAAASVGVWFLLYGAALLITRPARPEPTPATQELPGTEPPAVVSLLAGYWDLSEDAAESTLIDLAARRYLEFRQPGNDPMQTTVHVRVPDPGGLTAYERRIFDRVNGLAVGGVVPLPALTFRDQSQAAAFEKRVRAEVIADARARGLSRRRFGPAVLTLLNATAAVAGVGVAAAVALASRHSHDIRGIGAAGLITFGALTALAHKGHGERDTPAGREVAARWLGVKGWLRNTEAFADLPPSAVAVWDRYLSYGAALGTTRVSSAVIDLGMGNRKRVWSSFGGTWHRVRVHYPRFWPRYGRTAPRLILRGTVFAALGFLLLYYWARGVAAVVQDPSVSRTPVAHVAGTVTSVGFLLGLVLFLYGAYVLARTVIDLATPVTVTGQVLWRQVWRQTAGGENSPPRPWLHYLAVDDGTDDRTTAWAIPSTQVNQCRDGDTVTLTARRWTRRVLTVRVVEPGSARRVQVADPDEQNTEALVAVAMGLPAPGQRAPGIPAALVTADEVSRALGAPVTVQERGGMGPVAVGVSQFHTPDGQVAAVLMVLRGLAAKAAMRARRGQPLPGIGDEAYTGPGWAVARRGDTVVGLTLQGRGQAADPRSVYWLLSTAVARLAGVPGGAPTVGPGASGR
ncbi:MAG: DUF2207 domain-containing protein [Actinobacteria bacterium]|nr:MAG: DUF2207 domain-containing protein [Actinomycetota bacterium]